MPTIWFNSPIKTTGVEHEAPTPVMTEALYLEWITGFLLFEWSKTVKTLSVEWAI